MTRGTETAERQERLVLGDTVVIERPCLDAGVEEDGADDTDVGRNGAGVGTAAANASEPLDRIDDLAVSLGAIGQDLDGLTESVAQQREQIAELLARDELFGQLHERLAGYEQDERRRTFIEPLTRKLAALQRSLLENRAFVEKALRSLPQPLRSHSAYFWSGQVLEGICIELESVLADFGVEPFTSESNRFDRTCQEAVQRVAATDAAQVGRIATRIAPGLRIEDRVIIAEQVAVFVGRTTG